MIDTYRRIISLLNITERRRFYALLVMILIMGFVEVVGVASIMPFFAVLSNPEVVHTNSLLSGAYRNLGFSSTQSFLMVLGFLVFTVVVFGLIFKAITVFALTRFSYMRINSIGSRLLCAYLRQPYEWFLDQHSSDLSKVVLSEVEKVVSGAVVPATKILAQLTIIAFLVALIVVIDPFVALMAGATLGGSYTLIYVGVRRYLTAIGKDRVTANQERYRTAQEVLNGIKDVKVRGLEEVYHRKFQNASFRFASREAINQIIAALPRFLLEAVAFGGMLGLMLFLLSASEDGLSGVLPLMALYAFAAFRILPALQQFYAGVTLLRYARPALFELSESYRQIVDHVHSTDFGSLVSERRLQVKEAVELRDVFFAYPKTSRMALNGLNMRIRANTTVALVGSSGAGKTTAADVILGLLWPSRGGVFVDEVAVTGVNARGWQRTIGYVPQQIFLTSDSVAANIALGVPEKERDDRAIERAARAAELHDFVSRQLPDGYNTNVGERGVRLSGGQRQRIGVARALYHDPDVLILDEATSALDNVTERAVMDAVHNLSKEKTIILIAHRLTTVQTCDEIFVFQDGQVADSGTYSELLDRCAVFRAMAAPGSAQVVFGSAIE